MRAFYYHDCDREEYTTPRSSRGNIKGLELEISDEDSYEILEELIYNNEIIDRDNTEYAGSKNYTICIENDSTVYKELIFKATTNRKLLKGVKMLSDNLHGAIDNHCETSCHIHINNDYLYERGINRTSIIRATEFILPILYEISGREEHYSWCKPMVSVNGCNLFERCNAIDNLYADDYDCDHQDRYFVTNVTGEYTTEIRCFSNRYNFNYDYIKMYLETTDFIIELADEMKNKSYVDSYEFALNEAKNHFEKRKYKDIYEEHELKKFFLSPEEQIKFYYQEQLRKFRNKIDVFNKYKISRNESDNLKSFFRIIRDSYKEEYGRIKFDISNLEYNEIFEIIINGMEEHISSL